MESITDLNAVRRSRGDAEARSSRRFSKRVGKLAFEALDCLEELMTDSDVKPADRIAAAKLTIEVFGKHGQTQEPADPGLVRVVFEGMPGEYAE